LWTKFLEMKQALLLGCNIMTRYKKALIKTLFSVYGIKTILCLSFSSILPLLLLLQVWDTNPDWTSPNGKLPVWDFENLWSGGKLAIQGSLDTLFNEDHYRSWLRSRYSGRLEDSEWSYPPSMLLLGAPLSFLPMLESYLLWTFGTLLLLISLLRLGGISIGVCVLVLASPAVLHNAAFGQNGALTAALLCGGLLLAPNRPILAGVLFGLLTIKPHLGVIIPFCLLASGNWRAIAAAVTTAAALVAITAGAFGSEAWFLFMKHTAPLMTAILEAPYPGLYVMHTATMFALVRAAGFSLGWAYIVQVLAALVAIVAAWNLWRMPDVKPTMRMAMTVLLAMLTTPYAYTYDMVGVAVATAILVERRGWQFSPLMIVLWAWPGLNKIFILTAFPATALLMILAAWQIWHIIMDEEEQDVGHHRAPPHGDHRQHAG
jgi:hypothetical protein